MKKLLIALAISSAAISLYAQSSLQLLSGNSMQLWNQQGQWSASSGTLITNGSGTRYVLSAVPFGELKLHFEYNETGPMGAKLHLWADKSNNGGLVVDLDRSGASSGVGGIEVLAHSSMGSISEGWHKVDVEASDGQVRVSVDGQNVTKASGLGSRTGFLGFEANGAGGLQVRNLTLTPSGLNKLFNGSDLGGWKSVARGADAKAGMGHALMKTFSFGAAGGSTKAHDAKWTVQGGAIKGEDGPGALENSTMADDAILQVSASVKGEIKVENFASLTVRGTQGQLGAGYSIGLGPYAGSINPVARRGFSKESGSVEETIVIAGRTIAVWIGSTLVQVHTDTRAENANPAQGSKIAAGTVSLVLLSSGEQIEVKRVAMAALAKTYGVAAKAPAPPPPPPPTATVAAPATPSVAETALLQQQQAEAKKSAEDQKNKQRSASLMTQALSTTDPQQQMQYYGQVVQIDPTNAAAVQGYKEAQTKLQATQTAEQQAESKQQQQQQDVQSKEQQTNSALVQAQSNFLAGKLGEASTSLSVAERLAPGNPLVRDLRSRISSAQSLRGRLYFLGGGVGVLGTITLLGLWWRRRRQHRFAVLEITRGLNIGKAFPLDKDTVRIGAVAQDAGQKNDFVVQDVEHQISRFHCEVTRKNGQLYVTDLRSSNGTRLNGELLKAGAPALLRKGNRITLASTVDLTLTYQRRDKKDA